MQYGRDIDRILYLYHFKKETAANVINTLETYCNDDGGIGCLESDSMYEGSMPINCSHFFSIIHCLKVKDKFKAAIDALEYLRRNVKKNGSWHCAIQNANNSPHAAWLNWDKQSDYEYSFHPTSELLGYFYHFGGGDFRVFSKEMLDVLHENLLTQPIGTLKTRDIIGLMQMCRLISDVMAERFVSLLEPHLKEALVTDQSLWDDFVLSPLSIFLSPFDPLYYAFEKQIVLNLNHDIMCQNEMGYWTPKWNWGQFKDEHLLRKNQISAEYTLNKLIILKNFKRITSSG